MEPINDSVLGAGGGGNLRLTTANDLDDLYH